MLYESFGRGHVLFTILALIWMQAVSADPNTTNLDANGLAVQGYDPVAYFTLGKPLMGKPEYSTTFDDATYRFANSANREAFQRTPDRYVPQYGGYCALGVSLGRKFDGDPQQWKIVGGKLYLNVNADAARVWNRDIPGNITKADAQWPKIGPIPAAELE